MTYDYQPHTKEWFEALRAFNPRQAAHTERIIQQAGSSEVCSVCGDKPAPVYRAVAPEPVDRSVVTIRLCADCRSIRQYTQGEQYEPMSKSN